jgi:DME family drug/metabolite transporter
MKYLKTYGPLLIVVAALLWGVDGVLRRSLFTLPASVIVFYEHLVGAIILAPFALAAWRKEKVTKKDWLALLWISLLSGVTGTLLFTAALIKVNFISLSVVFLLQKLQPVFAVGAAAVLLKEKVTARYVGWAALALVAAYFVTFKNGYIDFHTGAGTAIAALMAVGAAFAWGSSTAVSRMTLLNLSSTLTTGLRFFLTVPLALIVVFLLGNSAALSTIQTDQVFRLILIALTTGMVALWIYYKGLQNTKVKVATILEFVFPVTAVVIDVLYYHSVLAPSQYLAALVLFFAQYQIVQLNRSKE